MKYNLAMPYMGSKRKLAPKIIREIKKRSPNATAFYDLCGGGGAMSFMALQCYDRVIYNELDSGVVAVLKDLQQCGFCDKYYQWIGREAFGEHKNDGDWFGGLCSIAWSFGSKGDTYLFGKDIEPLKKLAHEFVVFDDQRARRKLVDWLDIEIPEQLCNDSLFGNSIKEKRLAFSASLKKQKRFDFQRLEQLQRLERLQQLERLEQLQRLERLEQLQQLEISNKTYSDVKIKTPPESTIIYLDPPYEKTATYTHKFNHGNLKKWILKSKYDIYMSGYECEYMDCVAEFVHTCSLSATATNAVTERLYFRAGATTV